MRKGTRGCLVGWSLLPAVGLAVGGGRACAEDARWLAGAPLRIVWCQAAETNCQDTFAMGDRLRLMAYDSEDGRGERPLQARIGGYHKPLLTPDGRRIVYTDYPVSKVHVVQWDGSGDRVVGDGVAADTWRDPRTGEHWVYTVRGEIRGVTGQGPSVWRFPIDRPDARELVWDRTPVAADNFQVSDNGTLAAGLFPWPDAGLADLARGTWDRKARGCWPSLAPGDTGLMWVFDGSHREITLFPAGGLDGWGVSLCGARRVAGREVYHPRWSNHPRFLAITGPYECGYGQNRIGACGDAVEVYLGRFTADFRDVDRWERVTRNDYADLYPDAWIATGDAAVATGMQAGATGGVMAVKAGPPPAAGGDGLVAVRAQLVSRAVTPSPEAIRPYREALIAAVFEVESAASGGPGRGARIAAASWGIRDGKVAPWERRIGESCELRIVPFERRPELEGHRLIIDAGALDLPLFYEAAD